MFTVPQFTAPNPISFVLHFYTNLSFFVKIVYKPPILTTPLSYSLLSSPVFMHIAHISRHLYSPVNLSFVSLNCRFFSTEYRRTEEKVLPLLYALKKKNDKKEIYQHSHSSYVACSRFKQKKK